MSQNSLHDVERHLVFHQPRRQRVPQRVGIDLADLAAFGNRGQPDLKALGIEVRPGLGREQQPVRVRPCGICQREQMPDQKLTQAVRDRDLAIRRACLRRVLDDIGVKSEWALNARPRKLEETKLYLDEYAAQKQLHQQEKQQKKEKNKRKDAERRKQAAKAGGSK